MVSTAAETLLTLSSGFCRTAYAFPGILFSSVRPNYIDVLEMCSVLAHHLPYSTNRHLDTCIGLNLQALVKSVNSSSNRRPLLCCPKPRISSSPCFYDQQVYSVVAARHRLPCLPKAGVPEGEWRGVNVELSWILVVRTAVGV